MPVYNYKCKYCDNQFEAEQPINEDPLIDCYKCDCDGLYRVIGSVGVSFKGNGFYSTDNKK
jgi:putative FmdB family regulatory protein